MMPTGLAQNLSFILLGEDRTASKTMTKAQQTAEVVTGRIGGAFSKLGGIIGGEFGQILDQTGSEIDKIGAKGVNLSTVLEAGGAITTGAGIALMQLGSGAKQATDQLDAAIVANGDSVEHFDSQIEDAVKSGENFNHSAEDTKQALTNLIPATGSTAAALSYMNVVTNLAAKNHSSLADASTLVAKILAGSGTRTLNQYGITMDGVGTKTQQGQKALDELGKKLDGQASASVKNFGSQFDIVKTKVEDFIKDAAGPVGQTMTVLGPVFSVAGLAIDIYKTKQEAATIATIAQTAAATDATAATEAETVAQTGLDGAMDANPIGLVALALGGLAAIVGGTVLLGGTNANTLATANFTEALKTNTAATNENIRAIATEALLKDGALKAGQKLGLSAATLVDASLGVASAQRTVNAVVDAGTKKLSEQTKGVSDNANGAVRMTQAQRDAASSLATVGNAVASVNQQYKDQTANQKLFKSGMDETGSAADTAAGKVGGLASQLHNLGLSSPGSVAISIAPKSSIKMHAAGGSFVTSSPGMLTPFDQVGESGPERVDITPLNAGRRNTGGVAAPIININLSGTNIGSSAEFKKTITSALIDALKGGSSKTELKHALGLV